MKQIFLCNSYEAPVVEVIEVEVEKGFAASGGAGEGYEEGGSGRG